MPVTIEDLRNLVDNLTVQELAPILPKAYADFTKTLDTVPLHKLLSGEGGAEDEPSAYKDIHIRDIPLSNRARNCLNQAGIDTADKLLSLSDEQLLSLRNCGVTTLKELGEVKSRIRAGNFSRKAEKQDLDFLVRKTFQQGVEIVDAWISDLSKKNRTVFDAISSSEDPGSYATIASKAGISRERVRQIRERLLVLFLGQLKSWPPLKSWAEDIDRHSVHTSVGSVAELAPPGDRPPEYLCRMALLSLGFSYNTIMDRGVYCKSSYEGLKVLDLLRDSPHNISPDNLGEGGVDWLIALSEMDQAERHPQLPRCWRVPLHRIRSSLECAWRILNDSGSPMHYQDMQKLLQGEYDRRNLGTAPHMRARMVADQRFTCIGRSGLWSLAEWGVDSRTIKELAVEAITNLGGSAELKDIYQYVSAIRPGVSEGSIRPILKINSDTFGYEAGRFFLSEGVKEEKVPSGQDSIRFSRIEAVLDLLSSGDAHAKSSLEIKKVVMPEDEGLGVFIIDRYLRNLWFLDSVDDGDVTLWSLRDGLTKEYVLGLESTRIQQCESLVERLLPDVGDEMLLTDFLMAAQDEFGIKRSVGYKAVDDISCVVKFRRPDSGKGLVLKRVRK